MIGFQYVCLLHDNVPAHTSEIVKQILKVRESNCLATPSVLPRSSPLLVGNTPPDKPLAQPSVSASVYLNQPTLTHSRSGFTDLRYVFPNTENSLKGCKVKLAPFKEIQNYMYT